MTLSDRDNLRQRRDFAITGTEIPERLRPTRPVWIGNPPIVPPRNPNDPFGDPPRAPHDVEPPTNSPHNYPDGTSVVTDNRSGQAGANLGGGLLGLMRGVMQQVQVQPNANSASALNGTPEYYSDSYGSLPKQLARQAARAARRTRPKCGRYLRKYDPHGSSAISTYADPLQQPPAIPHNPVRILSRRLAR
jgi:hypothetical protein